MTATLDKDWLYRQGYTIRQAARAVGRSEVQVRYVLSGKRSSRSLEAALRKLPRRPLQLRERISR